MSSEGAIYRVIANERRKLDRMEQAARGRLARVYLDSLDQLNFLMDDVSARIEERRRQGLPITPGWLYQQARYRQMIEQAREAGRALALQTGQQALELSAGAAQMGVEQAQTLLGMTAADPNVPAAFVHFSGINEEAVQAITAELSPGSPLLEILAEFPNEAAKSLRETLTRGMALGLGVDAMRRQIKGANARQLVRANTIIRTEIHRAHREATRATFQANAAHLNGWIWMADLSPRTCPVCWSMHGTKHPLTEAMASHPCCRCTLLPLTKSFAELGIGIDPTLETRVEVEPGADVFARLPLREKIAILGPGGYDLYRQGAPLADFVRVTKSAKWGVTRSVQSNRAIAQKRGIAPISKPLRTPTLPPAGVVPIAGGAKGSPQPDQLHRDLIGLPAIDQVGQSLPILSKDRRDHSENNWAQISPGPLISVVGHRVNEKDLLHDAVLMYTETNMGRPWYRTIRDALNSISSKSHTSDHISADLGWALQRAIHFSDPLPMRLYRGMSSETKDPIDLGQVGDVIDYRGSASFSADPRIAWGFARGSTPGTYSQMSHLPNHETMVVVEPGALGIKIDALSNWNQAEVITSGQFEIVSVDRTYGTRINGLDFETTTYTIRQRFVWEPPDQPPYP